MGCTSRASSGARSGPTRWIGWVSEAQRRGTPYEAAPLGRVVKTNYAELGDGELDPDPWELGQIDPASPLQVVFPSRLLELNRPHEALRMLYAAWDHSLSADTANTASRRAGFWSSVAEDYGTTPDATTRRWWPPVARAPSAKATPPSSPRKCRRWPRSASSTPCAPASRTRRVGGVEWRPLRVRRQHLPDRGQRARRARPCRRRRGDDATCAGVVRAERRQVRRSVNLSLRITLVLLGKLGPGGAQMSAPRRPRHQRRPSARAVGTHLRSAGRVGGDERRAGLVEAKARERCRGPTDPRARRS